MLTYQERKTGRTMQVEERETVRRSILERIGWRIVYDNVLEDAPIVTPMAIVESPLLDLALPDEIIDVLTNGGFRSMADVDEASDAELLALPGIGKASLAKIRQALIDLEGTL